MWIYRILGSRKASGVCDISNEIHVKIWQGLKCTTLYLYVKCLKSCHEFKARQVDNGLLSTYYNNDKKYYVRRGHLEFRFQL